MSFSGTYNVNGLGSDTGTGPSGSSGSSGGGSLDAGTLPECGVVGTSCTSYTGQTVTPNCLVDGSTLFCATDGGIQSSSTLCSAPFLTCAPYKGQAQTQTCLLDGSDYICLGTLPTVCFESGVSCSSFAGGAYPAGCGIIGSYEACGGPYAGAPAGVAPADPTCFQYGNVYACPTNQPGVPISQAMVSTIPSCALTSDLSYVLCTVDGGPIAQEPNHGEPASTSGLPTADCEFAPGKAACTLTSGRDQAARAGARAAAQVALNAVSQVFSACRILWELRLANAARLLMACSGAVSLETLQSARTLAFSVRATRTA